MEASLNRRMESNLNDEWKLAWINEVKPTWIYDKVIIFASAKHVRITLNKQPSEQIDVSSLTFYLRINSKNKT